MIKYLKNNKLFFIIYFAFLMLDICVKYNYDSAVYRIFSKPIPGILLLLFYINNVIIDNPKKHNYMLMALTCFILGDIIFVFKGVLILALGMLFFMVGKVCYALRFSNDKAFSTSQIIPLLIGAFLYMIFIINLVFEALGYFFVPVSVYLFVLLIVLFFAYIRRGSVPFSSFVLVLVGILFSIVSDSLKLLQLFHDMVIPFEKFLSTFIYGTAQFLIVLGVIKEQIKEA